MTPSVWAVIGTARPKGLNVPGRPRTAISAARTATRARSRAGRRRVTATRVVASRWGADRVVRARSALVEGVAAADVPRPVPGGEPVAALLRGPMGEALGVDAALRLPLDPVVAHGGGGLLGLGDVVLGQVDPVLPGRVGEV